MHTSTLNQFTPSLYTQTPTHSHPHTHPALSVLPLWLLSLSLSLHQCMRLLWPSSAYSIDSPEALQSSSLWPVLLTITGGQRPQNRSISHHVPGCPAISGAFLQVSCRLFLSNRSVKKKPILSSVRKYMSWVFC